MTTFSTESHEERRAAPLRLPEAGNEPTRRGDEPTQRRQDRPARNTTRCCAAIIDGFDGFLG